VLDSRLPVCCQIDIWLYIAVLFISNGRISFLAPIFDSADPLFALMIAPGFYLHHVETELVEVCKHTQTIYMTCVHNYSVLMSCSLQVVD